MNGLPMNLSLEPIYMLIGGLMFWLGCKHLRGSERTRGAFWLLLGALFAASSIPALPSVWIGALVIVIAFLAFAANSKRAIEDEAAIAERSLVLAGKLVRPAILLPLLTLAATLLLRYGHDQKLLQFNLDQAALYGLFVAVIISLGYAVWSMKLALKDSIAHGANLLDQVGWPIFLPLLLAMLGSVFATAGVGTEVSKHLSGLFPINNRYACVAAFGLGMAAFSMIMGNAFAAFPVMTLAIGVPLIVVKHGGDPLAMASMGMLCGYCGTLMTPLAANFNLVPAALLGLQDRFAVIKAQWPTAVPLLICNIGLMCWLVYR